MTQVKEWFRTKKLDDTTAIVEFERVVAEIFGTKYGIFVNSGSSANLLACFCMEFKAEDEVITPACTFPTTLSPIVFCGAKAVFCDVEKGYIIPSVQMVLDCITPKTKCILIPDLVGDKFDFIGLKQKLKEINREDIKMIEDACDTITHCDADIATVSFYPSHVISSGGMGGMVLTNSDEYAEKCYRLRKCDLWDFSVPPFCASFGIENAKKFPEIARKRKENFNHYCERLKDCPFYQLPKNKDCLWLSMPLVCNHNRFDLVSILENIGIQTRLCMAGNILRQPYYKKLFNNVDPGRFKNTEDIFRGGILVGLHQGLSIEDIDFVCDKLIEIAKEIESKK